MANVGSKKFMTDVLSEIRQRDALHAKTLMSADHGTNGLYNYLREAVYRFFVVSKVNATQAALDYLKFIGTLRREQAYFDQFKCYSCASQRDAYNKVYARDEVMAPYMNALLLSQLLWQHHYDVYEYFNLGLKTFFNSIDARIRVLDIGAGHGLFSTMVADTLVNYQKIDVVDISESALTRLARVNGHDRTEYHRCDINQFNAQYQYDLVIMGEVLEHLDEPLRALINIKRLLKPAGVLWLTVPLNAPAPDHVYLFSRVADVFGLIDAAGYHVLSSIERPAVGSNTILVGVFCTLNK